MILTLCIITREEVNLNKLKKTVGTVTGNRSTLPSSNYKRLTRIFSDKSYYGLWIKLLVCGSSLLRLKSDHILMDGTCWKRGTRTYHYLTLCVLYKGVAVPIYFEDLERKGVSSVKQRIAFMSRAGKYYNLKGKTLLADREYIGRRFFKYLTNSGILFIIRLRTGEYMAEINQANGNRYSKMEKKVLRSKVLGKTVKKTFEMSGETYQVVMTKNLDGDSKEPIIYMISNLDEPAKVIANQYFLRWKIETCFKNMKNNGFSLEGINLKDPERARLMFAIVSFAYALSISEGLKDYEKVPEKEYKDGSVFKAESVFRYGLDKLGCLLEDLYSFTKYLFGMYEAIERQYFSPKSINVQ